MEKLEKIEFKVGEKYENEIGVFEVMSIKGERMVMQQETGAEIITDINLQRRIQERRLWEKLVREKNVESAAAKSRRTAKGRSGKIYEGLQSADFRNKISGTGWRSREQLGDRSFDVRPIQPQIMGGTTSERNPLDRGSPLENRSERLPVQILCARGRGFVCLGILH
jgi:hypothetical protein